MKKILSILICLFLALSLSSCGQKDFKSFEKEVGFLYLEKDNEYVFCYEPEFLFEKKAQDVSDEIKQIYEEAEERILKVLICDFLPEDYESTVYDDEGRYLVTVEGLNSKEDLKNYLKEYFSDELTDTVLEYVSSSYIEKDGRLWAFAGGVGGPYDLVDYYPLKMYTEDDGSIYLLVEEETYHETEDNWYDFENEDNHVFYEHLFMLEKEDGKYVFTQFTELMFGWINNC